MIPSLLMSPVRLVLGTIYPAYASYKAIRTKNVREYVKWMMYWVVLAILTSVEVFADFLIGLWCPFYYELKFLLFIWLASPVPGSGSIGSSVIYRKFVHPNLTKKEAEIDRWIKRVQNRGYQSVAYYGNRALYYASDLVVQG